MDWETAKAVTAIVTAIIGVATAYLRLSIGAAVSRAKEEILREVDNKYARKDVVEAHWKSRR